MWSHILIMTFYVGEGSTIKWKMVWAPSIMMIFVCVAVIMPLSPENVNVQGLSCKY
jgi:hypothetical protein